MTQVTSFGAVYGLMLAYCLCYFPTIALTNSLALKNMKDAGSEFPLIRVFGTIGWIVIGLVVGKLAVEKSPTMFLLAAGASVVMGLYSLTLPHTPPAGAGEPVTARALLGLDALVMLKRRTYLVFIIASILGCIPLTFYFTFTNAYLNEIGVQNAAGKMTLGQFSEIGAMLLMPWVFKRMSVRAIIMLGLLSWSLRYGLLAYGNPGRGSLDVLHRHPAARRLLRLLLHDRPVVRRPGSAGEPPCDRSGLSDLCDLWRRDVYRFAALGRGAGLLHDEERRHGSPSLDEFLAQLRRSGSS